MKVEPDVFSIQDLARAPKKTTFWDGVRNYQARNFMRDQMQIGDGVLYYHSNAEPSGIAGTATIARAGSPDPSDEELPPRWYGVEVKLKKIFPRLLALDELRRLPALKNMVLFKASRLSVQPVTPGEWKAILELAQSGHKKG